MIDFVGDILRNAYNPDAANWTAPEVNTYAPTQETRNIRTAQPVNDLLWQMEKQRLERAAALRGDNASDQRLTGNERRYLDSLRRPSYSNTTQNYWTVDGQEFDSQSGADARAAELNAAEQAKAQNPFISEGQVMGLPGFSANELVQSGYLDNVDQARGLVFDPQSSYNAQRAIALDRFGDDDLTRLLTEAAAPGVDVSQYATRDRLDPLVGRIDAGMNLTDDANTQYDFGNFLNADAAQSIVDDILTSERDTARQGINTAGGFGYDPLTNSSQYARDTFNDTLDDNVINNILGGQQERATNTLGRALGYGQISQGGYDAALRALGDQRSAAESRIGDYTSSLLEGYRGDTDRAIGNLYNTAGNLRLGETFAEDLFASLWASLSMRR